MQTFLPHEDFKQSAQSLDYRRLGKQRVETWQIWITISTGRKSWSNHPAVKMWRGHEEWLIIYGIEMCVEWRSRGYKDTMLVRFLDTYDNFTKQDPLPPWIGLEQLHSSHRANLLRKNPTFYSKFGWTDDPKMGYYWPTEI